jgi:hypothetical protein
LLLSNTKNNTHEEIGFMSARKMPVKEMGKDTQIILGIIPILKLREEREKEAQAVARVRASQIRVFGDVDQARERLFVHGIKQSQENMMLDTESQHRTDPLDKLDSGSSFSAFIKEDPSEE